MTANLDKLFGVVVVRCRRALDCSTSTGFFYETLLQDTGEQRAHASYEKQRLIMGSVLLEYGAYYRRTERRVSLP